MGSLITKLKDSFKRPLRRRLVKKRMIAGTREKESGMKLRIHPLFLVCGLFYVLTGRLSIFVIYTATAFLHELGHSYIAAGRGYALNKITLMPFGAVISGDLDALSPIDEIKIALAGPLLNLLVGVFFVALWWIYPECYAYTDIAAEANFSMALVNFIPAYPLDGGRVLSAVIANSTGRKKAISICKKVGGVMGLGLLLLFIFSLFNTPNPSLLFFALFVTFGNRVKNSDYVRALSVPSTARLRRGMPFKKQGLDKSVSVRKLLSILDPDAINEIVVFDGVTPLTTLSQERIRQIAMTGEYSAPIERYLTKIG